MPDNSNLSKVNESVLIDKIANFVYQFIIDIQQQQPDFLNEKYRKINWGENKNKSLFLDKLKSEISLARDGKTLIIHLKKFLQILLIHSFFESANFKFFLANLHHFIEIQINPNSQEESTENNADSRVYAPVSDGSIAILLLDAENLQIDADTEKFLARICTYPLQIKIAFANWRSLGKQDLEFHGRGYELIHVPQGKDSADFKMSTVGSSIFVHYPTAKEVLVCSSDNGLTHLCNTLQTHGLTVYRVRKQGDNITVLNSKTGETKTHSLKPIPEIPSIPQLIIQIKALIKAEQKRTGFQWIKLSRVSNLFQTKYNLTITQVVSTHLPEKKTREIFSENPTDFVLHQLPNQSNLYVTLFDVPQVKKTENKEEQELDDSQNNLPLEINSLEDLEQVLVALVQELTVNSPSNAIYLEAIGTEFNKKYGQPINIVIKDNLKFNGSLLKILQSFKSFKLEQKKGKWWVAIAKP